MLESRTPLTGTALLDSATVGVHYYDSRALENSTYFTPPHKDSGTLTMLFRSHVENDGLEIADLDSTEETDSDAVGRDATFIPIPTAIDEATEVIVFAGLRLQRMLGSERVRACVHEYVALVGGITKAADYND
jgi:isopenicillin N synthase-like dioxygenase